MCKNYIFRPHFDRGMFHYNLPTCAQPSSLHHEQYSKQCAVQSTSCQAESYHHIHCHTTSLCAHQESVQATPSPGYMASGWPPFLHNSNFFIKIRHINQNFNYNNVMIGLTAIFTLFAYYHMPHLMWQQTLVTVVIARYLYDPNWVRTSPELECYKKTTDGSKLVSNSYTRTSSINFLQLSVCMIYKPTGSGPQQGRWAPYLHSSQGGKLYLSATHCIECKFAATVYLLYLVNCCMCIL